MIISRERTKLMRLINFDSGFFKKSNMIKKSAMLICRRGIPALFVGLGLSIFAACSHTPTAPENAKILSTFVSVSVNSNVHNVLSASVTARTTQATALAVEYGSDSLFAQITPFVPINGDSARVPVLGLSANQQYAMRAVAVSTSGHKTRSAALAFRISMAFAVCQTAISFFLTMAISTRRRRAAPSNISSMSRRRLPN
jgi:hypothetical protein